MTSQQLTTLLCPHLVEVRMGLYEQGEYDLGRSLDGQAFILRLDINTHIVIPLKVKRANAQLIQSVVRAYGKEVIHTWNQQYSRDP